MVKDVRHSSSSINRIAMREIINSSGNELKNCEAQKIYHFQVKIVFVKLMSYVYTHVR